MNYAIVIMILLCCLYLLFKIIPKKKEEKILVRSVKSSANETIMPTKNASKKLSPQEMSYYITAIQKRCVNNNIFFQITIDNSFNISGFWIGHNKNNAIRLGVTFSDFDKASYFMIKKAGENK